MGAMETLVLILDLVGTFVFALSGAMLGANTNVPTRSRMRTRVSMAPIVPPGGVPGQGRMGCMPTPSRFQALIAATAMVSSAMPDSSKCSFSAS